jgi:outer membrane biosynthesis protein TonB
MQLAEDSIAPVTARVWLWRGVVAVFLIGTVAGLAVIARTLVSAPDAPKRQVAKISILPDTPPPPPPPREEPKKLMPKDEQKQVVQQAQPKPQQAPPADAPIKMEGAAGDGPSAFGAGTVTQDYRGGPPVVGAASGPVSTGIDRANERFYANSARQLLRDEIERQLRPEAGELTATFAIWIEPDGRIRRYEVNPSGDSARDADMGQALEGASRSLRLPAPGALNQPMRFRVTVRPQG